ncbi:MAG: YjjG family noncanonical pyrimidine nucleotidase [Defluviitaleaceae bacterium]|nr:YjjG family noncanonical pyrimidine nucleotidase [Defluviitaleaceae bacterium]
MKKYTTFLFDADDTLYDYRLSTAYALKSMFEQCGFAYSDGIQARYGEINRAAWASYEKGEISVDDMQKVRFSRLFDEIGVYHDPESFNAGYLYEFGKGIYLIEGALEICRAIFSRNKHIYIVTNGLVATQEARAKHSPLNKYITGFFVSQIVGHQKPSLEYFRHVFTHISASKDEMIIIGDSLTADIAGGNNASIDTCWLNIHGTQNHTNIKPTYEIHNLRQLQQFI